MEENKSKKVTGEKVRIPNKLIFDLSKDELLVYSCIRNLVPKHSKVMPISSIVVCVSAIGRFPKGRQDINYVSSTIKSLREKGAIKILDEEGNYIVLDAEQFLSIESNYLLVDPKLVATIISKHGMSVGASIYKYGLTIDALIPQNKKYAVLSLSTLERITKLSTPTILRYNKFLEDLHIIYIFRSNLYTRNMSNNKSEWAVKRINNIYGRYEDRELVQTSGKAFEALHTKEFSSTRSIPNSSRSMSMKYNHWLRGSEYSLDELKEIYEYLNKRNKQFTSKGDDYHTKDLSKLETFINAKDNTVVNTTKNN